MRDSNQLQIELKPTAIESYGRVATDARADRLRSGRLLTPLLIATALFFFISTSLSVAQASALQTSSQSDPTATSDPTAPAAVHPHKHRTTAHPATEAVPALPEPETPPVPEQPKWPAFDHANEASVVWDSHGLTINATNSSLQQIMRDVSTSTGVRVDGMSADQRVFGSFGPGQARDVLSQLLQGSGYNVIMIGEQGKGAPRQILLSMKRGGNTQPAPRSAPVNANDNNVNDGSDDEPEEPPMPQQQENPVHPNFQPGAPPRSPQQILQEMQQRQQQQQQQQPQPQQ